MTQTQYFTNSNYKVLESLYDACDNGGVSHITQREIANRIGLSYAFVNEIIGILSRDGYVSIDKEHRGRYILSDVAQLTIKSFRNADVTR